MYKVALAHPIRACGWAVTFVWPCGIDRDRATACHDRHLAPGAPPDVARTLLSITMPTRNRPGLLERALRSVVRAVAPVAEHVEVAVSDGSDDGATGDVVERVLTGWPAGYRYLWNRPALSLVENMNRAAEISTGQWVMCHHDDDYLLPGAGAAMLDAIRRAVPGDSVLLFAGRLRCRIAAQPACDIHAGLTVGLVKSSLVGSGSRHRSAVSSMTETCAVTGTTASGAWTRSWSSSSRRIWTTPGMRL